MLNYGYTITFTLKGRTLLVRPAGGGCTISNGATIIMEVEGLESVTGIASGVARSCVVDVEHAGSVTVMTSKYMCTIERRGWGNLGERTTLNYSFSLFP